MKKYCIALLFLFCHSSSLRSDDRIVGAALFGISAIAFGALHRHNQKPVDPATQIIRDIQQQQAQQDLAQVRTKLSHEPKKQIYSKDTDTLIKKQKQEPVNYLDLAIFNKSQLQKKLSQVVECQSPATVATISPNISNNSLSNSEILTDCAGAGSTSKSKIEGSSSLSTSSALSTSLLSQAHQQLIEKISQKIQKPKQIILQPLLTNQDFQEYSFIATDGQEPEELPSDFNSIASEANTAVLNEPSLYEQSNIIAQANFQIRHLAGRYDNNFEIAIQAQDLCRQAFADHNDRIGKWQYMCDHIKQIGEKRVNINIQWSTKELHQIWIAKQMYQKCKSDDTSRLQKILTEYATLNSQTHQALFTAIKEGIKPLNQTTRDYLNRTSSSSVLRSSSSSSSPTGSPK